MRKNIAIAVLVFIGTQGCAPADNADETFPTEEASDFFVAQELLDAGYKKEAYEEAAATVGEKNVAIPKSLRKMNLLNESTELLGNLIVLLGQLIVLLGAALGAAFLLWIPIRRDRVAVAEFSDHSGELKAAATVRACIVDEIDSAKSNAGHMWRITGAGAELPNLADLPPPLSAVGALSSWLTGRKRIKVSGVVHSAAPQRTEISVLIAKAGKVRAWKSFHLDVEPSIAAFQKLGTLAGAWVAFKLQEIRPSWILKALAIVRPTSDPITMLGAQNWESYAEFRNGARARDSEARGHLIHALYLDRGNIGALIELGSLEGQEPDHKARMCTGIERLKLAKQMINERLLKTPKWRHRWAIGISRQKRGRVVLDPLWFRASYALAGAQFHQFAQNEDLAEQGEAEPALEKVRKLALHLQSELERLSKVEVGRLKGESYRDASRLIDDLRKYLREEHKSTKELTDRASALVGELKNVIKPEESVEKEQVEIARADTVKLVSKIETPLSVAREVGLELANNIGATRLALRQRRSRLLLISNSERESLLAMLRYGDVCYLASIVAACLKSLEPVRHDEGSKEVLQSADKALGVETTKERRVREKKLWTFLTKIDQETPAIDIMTEIEPTRGSSPNWSASYNEACFYARTRDYDRAVLQLKDALFYVQTEKEKDDAEWIRKDPTLRPLWAARGDTMHQMLDQLD